MANNYCEHMMQTAAKLYTSEHKTIMIVFYALWALKLTYFVVFVFYFVSLLYYCIIFCIHLCVTSLWNLVDFAAVCLGQDTFVKDIFNLKSHIFLGKQRLKTV